MDACEVVRRSILGSLGVLAGCSGDPHGGGDVVIPPPPSVSSSAAPVTSAAVRPPREEHGYLKAADGSVHRAGSERCDTTIDAPSCQGDERDKMCTADSDCKDGPHGKCASGRGMRGTFCGCRYACEDDADCKPVGGKQEACVCKTAVEGASSSQCAPAACLADSECASGSCGVSSHFNGCGTQIALACRSKTDDCWSSKDCQDGKSCAVRDDKWMCQGMTCVIGRPLLVDGRAIHADAALRGDWGGRDGALAIDAEPRALEHWLEVAAMEHASVASFAHFTLQLLAFGAPPDLVAGSQRAALDEIEHAKLAYGIASRLAGRALGPGPLAVPAHVVTELEAVVEALVAEGCVGETLGAIEALAQSEAAGVELKVALERIAEDERAHAELAWRSLAWFVRSYGHPAAVAARRALDRSRAELAVDPPMGEALPHFGILDGRELGALRRRAFEVCVSPAALAVLADHAGARSQESPVTTHA